MMPAATPDNPMATSQKYMTYIMPFFALTGLYWPFGLVLYWVHDEHVDAGPAVRPGRATRTRRRRRWTRGDGPPTAGRTANAAGKATALRARGHGHAERTPKRSAGRQAQRAGATGCRDGRPRTAQRQRQPAARAAATAEHAEAAGPGSRRARAGAEPEVKLVRHRPSGRPAVSDGQALVARAACRPGLMLAALIGQVTDREEAWHEPAGGHGGADAGRACRGRQRTGDDSRTPARTSSRRTARRRGAEIDDARG